MPPPDPQARLQRLSRHLRHQSQNRAGREPGVAQGRARLRGAGVSEDTKSTRREYDGQAEEYANVSYNMHNEVEFFSFFVQCGELSGKRVLDIASGEGRYTRMIKARGAARVVGLDLSDEMVKLADSDESQQRAESHIEYMQHDLAQPLPAPMRGGFDVVTSQYLLCYAPTTEILQSMAQNAFDALEPGGSFVSLTDNPANTPQDYGAWADYGIRKKTDATVGPDGLLPEGSSVTWVIQEKFESEVWIWSAETYTAVLNAVGFEDVEFFGMTVPSQFVFDREAMEHISARVITPPVIGVKARRPVNS